MRLDECADQNGDEHEAISHREGEMVATGQSPGEALALGHETIRARRSERGQHGQSHRSAYLRGRVDQT